MELETKRLRLRPLRDDDAPAMARGVNNINVSRNLARVSFPNTLQQSQDFIALQRTFDPATKLCAITFRCAPDELIGVVGYEKNENGEFEFGYWLRECCWKLGIMTEAATALVTHAFTQTEISLLHSSYHLDNPNSGRILRRLGFIETHRAMSFSLAQNREVPVMKTRLTRDRWQAQQKSRTS